MRVVGMSCAGFVGFLVRGLSLAEGGVSGSEGC